MDPIHPSLIETSVLLCRELYGYEFTRLPEDLAKLISDEFECICLPKDVEKYCVNLTEEEENIEIYKNI